MSKGHNKRRNTGLLYEFLIQTISHALVEGDQRRANVALKIVKKYFRPGSQLYREYRLINSLLKTHVSSHHVAASILTEAKAAARAYDAAGLDREKSLLISTINKSLNDPDFFDQQVNEYKMYATVQTLLNDWRSADIDLGRLAQYEDNLMEWLVSERPEGPDVVMSDDSPGAGRLLMKVMMRKLNEKYSGVLSDEQRQLIKAYAFATASDDPRSIRLKLTEIKQRLISEIDSFCEQNHGTESVDKKLNETRDMIAGEDLTTVDDETVTRFMLYTKLSAELTSEGS